MVRSGAGPAIPGVLMDGPAPRTCDLEVVHVRYYALLLFAGLRPESEAVRLSTHPRRDELIDLEHGEIELPAELTPKSSGSRTITIQPNLAAWLKAYPTPILPDRDVRRDLGDIRAKFGLSQDICRHSWFTYSIGRHDSISTAALEGGNSEAVVKDHYLKVAKKRKAKALEFWSILPLREKKIISFSKATQSKKTA